MAGEIEPSSGEMLKSAENLRVAFLRQEFIEQLVLERTLRDELLASFVEEQNILHEITECEESLSHTVDDQDKMNSILERMELLQEKAIAKGAYALNARVDKIMDLTGFSSEDASALVGSFSGGWKMRIGLAKILLLDP
jgi:ATP-binding cassette, subfamily F, member 3